MLRYGMHPDTYCKTDTPLPTSLAPPRQPTNDHLILVLLSPKRRLSTANSVLHVAKRPHVRHMSASRAQCLISLPSITPLFHFIPVLSTIWLSHVTCRPHTERKVVIQRYAMVFLCICLKVWMNRNGEC